jgi:hypothetical protein
MINARQDRAQRQSLKGPPQQSLTVISKKHTEKAAPNDLGLMLGVFTLCWWWWDEWVVFQHDWWNYMLTAGFIQAH